MVIWFWGSAGIGRILAIIIPFAHREEAEKTTGKDVKRGLAVRMISTDRCCRQKGRKSAGPPGPRKAENHEKYSAESSAAIKSSWEAICDGGGFSAMNRSFR